jgi:hypothetical protein
LGKPTPKAKASAFRSEIVKQIEKTTRGLAACMFEELELLRKGESTPQQARAKASIANTICQVARLEMDYARFITTARAENTEAMKALPLS